MERSLCNISVGDKVYFLSSSITSEQNDPEFRVTLIEASCLKAWKGTFGDIQENAKCIDLQEDELVDLTRKALTRQNMGDINFEYQVSSKKNKVELSWKKVVSSVKFQVGKVSLDAVSSSQETIQDTLLHSIETITDLKGSIYRLESENDRLSNERKQALTRLEKCVVQKEEMEGDLYGKFAVIVNEKKAKIRELKDRPLAASIHGDSDSHRSEAMKRDSDDAMDLGDDDTDEERQREESLRKKQKKTTAPSQTRTKRSDDSVTFDEELPEDTTSKARRRRREPTSRKTATSEKPAIPKVPSSGTPSTSRTPSMRKTPSREKSQTETDNVDDLLDQF
ncbi:DNA repair protein XRCC4 isoform X2 [Strongylocentrotus purpuratus]|uniref:XRCC4 n=1 Tax=Strongylocentrotus purpuratus TaxID=7668 RepID=A0A7M7PB67_STRPU|nr:DNA repair protein XRCC4 isoform X2 [Strongylocentrotus purpuratus]